MSQFVISANIRWDVALPTEKLQLETQSHCCQDEWILQQCHMTVVDQHTCSSPVVIKLGAFCVEVDVVVDRFEYFITFFVRMSIVHNKVRV